MSDIATGWRVQFLGTFAMWRGEERLPTLRTRKEAWLLALLVLRHPEPIERARLAGTLWPDSEETKARYNLRRSLNNLRTVLGPDALRLIEPAPHTLGLTLEGAWTDLTAFDTAIRSNTPDSLRQALDLYRGPFLEGCDEAWAVHERLQREQALLCALETLAEEAMAARRWAEASALLRRALDIDPLRESAVQRLMRSLIGAGETPTALEVYRDFRLLLGRELRAEPHTETRLLYQQIREGRGHQEATEASRTFPADEKPLPNIHLPHPLTALIGREKEVEAIDRDLQSARLVTLSGPGGIGKTRLAIAVATRSATRFTEGIWLVDLTAVDTAGQVASVIAQALNVQEDPQRATQETLCQALQARRLLLLLDNCEHLISACAEVAHVLLSACPDLHILATSRQSLGLAGECVRQVPPLALPPGPEEAEGAAGNRSEEIYRQIEASAAVRLFVERASAASDVFQITPHNAAAVAHICHTLEGVPYALELAAAWTKALEVAQIAERLRNPLHLPRNDHAPGGAHRQTLRAMLDWSYVLLSDPERRLLRELSVFVGGWSLEAAEAICGDVLEALTGLVDKSLVVYDSRSETKRYRLLETTRAFARELLPEGERAVIAERHAGYFQHAAAAIREDIYQCRHLQRGVRWSRTEQANCVAALQHLQARDSEAALRFRLDLNYLGVLPYHSPETHTWITEVYAETNRPGTALLADLNYRLGCCALWIGENAIGIAMLERACHIAASCGAERVQAGAAYVLGIEMMRLQRLQEAQQLLTQALKCNERAGSLLHAAFCRDVLCRLALEREDLQEALRLAECNRLIGRERQDDRILSTVAWRYAFLEGRAGNRAEAVRFLEEFVSRTRLCEAQPLETALQNAGKLAYEIGEYAVAVPYLEEAVRISREVGNRPGEGWALDTLALVASARREWEQAEAYALRSLRIFYDLGERGSASAGLARLGEISVGQGRAEREVTLLAHIEATLKKQPMLHTPDFVERLRARTAAQKEVLPPTIFEAAWQIGWNMTLQQAFAFALSSAVS